MTNDNKYRTHWFDREIPRTIITIILTASAAVCGGLITRFSHAGLTVVFIVLTIFFVAIQVIFSIRCSAFDKFREYSVIEMESKIKVYKKLFEDLPGTLDSQAEGINKIANDIIDKGVVSGDRWTFDSASTDICLSVASFVKNYSGTPVNVYYVRTENDDGPMVKMVGCANYYGDVPKTYMTKMPVNNENSTHFDVRMFAKKSLKAQYRLNSIDVDNAFSYSNREKEAGTIEQFLFIPVSCDKRKMIGLIEIIAPRGNVFAESDAEMKNLQKLLRVYSSIFVLLNKAEKAAIALPDIETKNS